VTAPCPPVIEALFFALPWLENVPDKLGTAPPGPELVEAMEARLASAGSPCALCGAPDAATLTVLGPSDLIGRRRWLPACPACMAALQEVIWTVDDRDLFRWQEEWQHGPPALAGHVPGGRPWPGDTRARCRACGLPVFVNDRGLWAASAGGAQATLCPGAPRTGG